MEMMIASTPSVIRPKTDRVVLIVTVMVTPIQIRVHRHTPPALPMPSRMNQPSGRIPMAMPMAITRLASPPTIVPPNRVPRPSIEPGVLMMIVMAIPTLTLAGRLLKVQMVAHRQSAIRPKTDSVAPITMVMAGQTRMSVHRLIRSVLPMHS